MSNKTLDITVTDTNTVSTIIYNENSPETPLAKAVMLSASHPILFKQEKGFTDGGASDNMPLIPLIKRGISLPNIITVSLNVGDEKQIHHHKLHTQKTHLSAPIQRLAVGANFTKAIEQSSKTKGVTSSIGNNLNLFSGEIKTTTMAVNHNELANSNVASYNSTKQFLEQRFSSYSERTELLFNLTNASQEIINIMKISSKHHQKLKNFDDSRKKVSKARNATIKLIKEQLISIISKTLTKDLDYNLDKKTPQLENSSNLSINQTKQTTFDLASDVEPPPQRTNNKEPEKKQSKQSHYEQNDSDDYYLDHDYIDDLTSIPQRRNNIESEKNQKIGKIFDIVSSLANIDKIITKEEVFNIKEAIERELYDNNNNASI